MPLFPRSTGLYPPRLAAAAARGLGDAAIYGYVPVYGYVRKLQPNGPLVGFPHHLFERVHRPGLYPLLAPTTAGSVVAEEHEPSAILQ